MNWKRYFKSNEGKSQENKMGRMIIVMQAAALVMLAYAAFTKNVVVSVKPYTLTGEAEVMRYSASANYLEAWGLFSAVTLGNVTPGNAQFVKESIGPLFHSSIYGNAIRIMDSQIEEIKQEQITTSFEPITVEYDPLETKKIFVTGLSKRTGPTGEQDQKTQTFEFLISIEDYQPKIKFMDVYAGAARVGRVLQDYRAEQAQMQAQRGGIQ